MPGTKRGTTIEMKFCTCPKSPLAPPFDLAQGMLFQRGGIATIVLMSLSGMVEIPRLQAKYVVRCLQRRQARSPSPIPMGEGRGEGPASVTPSPFPSPPRRRGGEGNLLVGFEPTIIETPRLRGEGYLVPPLTKGD